MSSKLSKKTIWAYPDKLHPPYSAASRTVTLNAAIISMITTCLDGTILSIPYVFYKTGLCFAPLCLLLVWGIYSCTLFNLSICIRKLQSVSYTEIIYRLFGQKIQILFSTLLFLIIFFIILGYFILMKNILKNLLITLFKGLEWKEMVLSTIFENNFVILLLLLIPILPLMLIENLEKLKMILLLGVISILFLIVVMMYLIGYDLDYYSNIINSPNSLYPPSLNVSPPGADQFKISMPFIQRFGKLLPLLKYYPSSGIDFVEGISIILILFVNHFNVCHLLSQLKEPTYERIQQLIFWQGLILTVVFTLIGFLGNIIFFIYSKNQDIEDNILLALESNNDSNKYLVIIAKAMMLLSLICTVPNMMTPVRLILYELERYVFQEYYHPYLKKEAIRRRSKSDQLVNYHDEEHSQLLCNEDYAAAVIKDWVLNVAGEHGEERKIENRMIEPEDLENRGDESVSSVSIISSGVTSHSNSCNERTGLQSQEGFDFTFPLYIRSSLNYGSFSAYEGHVTLHHTSIASCNEETQFLDQDLTYFERRTELCDFSFVGNEATWREHNFLPIQMLPSTEESINDANQFEITYKNETDDEQQSVSGNSSISSLHDSLILDSSVEATEENPLSSGSSLIILRRQALLRRMKENFNFYNKLTVTTIIVAIVVILAAVLPPNVSIVWEVAGSLITPWIAIILPSLCFIQLQSHLKAESDRAICGAWMTMIIGIIVFLICSARVVLFLFT